MAANHVSAKIGAVHRALITASLSAYATGLVAGLNDIDFGSVVSNDAASANQATYDQIKATTSCNDGQTQATQACNGGTFLVWKNVRELVHSANDLTGDGPTEFSLQQDEEQLGNTMRWTAGEEFAAQGSMSSNFINGQLSGLASRITALRYGSTGFRYTDNAASSGTEYMASNGAVLDTGGGAGDDKSGVGWSPWGGFINFSYVRGDKEATDREDAFDFDGADINIGFDYRYGDNWIFGVVAGYQQQLIDFDSSQSVVDGEIKGTGFSLMPFVLFQEDNWFWTLSLGYQGMTFDTERRISYLSNNTNIASTNTVSESDTSSQIFSAYSSGGYAFRPTSAFTVEPYLSFDYYNVNIDEYSENDLLNEGFNFTVLEQSIDYFEGAFGLKLQYTFTPRFGVIVPYFDAQWHHQFNTDARDIDAVYEEAASTLAGNSGTFFRLPTDPLDENYEVYAIGLSAVVRGARQREAGGPATGGIQTYINYRIVNNLEYYEQSTISLGLRMEF